MTQRSILAFAGLSVLPSRLSAVARPARRFRQPTARRPSGGYGVMIPLSLADVSPGRYVLRLEATTPGSDHTAAREIPIIVLP
jgi:hypothetical protein